MSNPKSYAVEHQDEHGQWKTQPERYATEVGAQAAISAVREVSFVVFDARVVPSDQEPTHIYVGQSVPLSEARYAVVSLRTESPDTVERYLPGNYTVMGTTLKSLSYGSAAVIGGVDSAGWTLEGYVLPRLSSGLISGYEIDLSEATRLLEES